ncbi:transporter [Micromonospora globispora]|uniref:Transporter n=1 Tax=Micromonospora globispora TaxID=1450148 RepID=A0A317K7B4_9ACTN|nr:transporter [Micromonospora globispora]PWU48272.1 transporter [Micromonospora globispora]PWU54048.1 transporter [Micromonospora globispora]RQW90599.1 transporter [Micromonospora globispora]
MIWLAWRQHRKQLLFTLIGFAALAALMIPIGLSMRHTFTDLGLPDCVREVARADVAPATAESCEAAFHRFTNRYGSLNLVAVLLLVLPMLVGLFWGAPLVAREVEHGTHRFAWTQGVGRTHWALVKFGLVVAVTVAAAVCYGLGMSWWVSPLTQAAREGRLGFIVFDLQGIAPIGYTLFAVALGIFAGTVWRRMLPAMTVTLVGFIGVRAAVAILARPHYQPARTLTFPIEGTGPMRESHGDWVLASGVRNADGKMVAADTQIMCRPGGRGPGGGACGAELGAGPGAYNWQLYQPAGRFWLFQGIETGIFVALAALLLYLAVRRIRRIA